MFHSNRRERETDNRLVTGSEREAGSNSRLADSELELVIRCVVIIRIQQEIAGKDVDGTTRCDVY